MSRTFDVRANRNATFLTVTSPKKKKINNKIVTQMKKFIFTLKMLIVKHSS